MGLSRYEDYSNPYVGQTAGLMLRGPEAQARGAMEAAAARARASEIGGQAQAGAAIAGGQAWGGAIQQIGQSVAAIPGQIQQQKRQAIQDQLGTQQVEANRLGLQEQQQKRADMLKLDELFANGQGRDAVINAAPGHLRPQILKQYQEADKIGAEARTASEVARKAQQEHLGYLGAQIRQAEYDPATALAAIHQARDTYSDDPTMLQQIDTLRAHVIEQPESIKQIADAAILGSSYKDLLKPKAPIQRDPTKDLLNPDTLAVVSRGTPKVEKETRSLDVQAAAALAAGDTETYNRLLKVKKEMGQADDRPRVNVSVGGGAGGLSPDAVEYTATQYRIMGPNGIPTRVEAADRVKILNEAAKQSKALGQSPAQAVQKQAAFKADGASLTKITNMASAAEAFETKANAQADLVRGLSKKVKRSDWTFANGVILSGKEAFGDTDAHLFANGLLTFTTEYAKLMEGSTGSAAGSSEGARRDAATLISKSLKDGTIDKTLTQMQWEMHQTRLGYDATIAHITERMGGSPNFTNSKENVSPTTTPSGMIGVTAPNGKTYQFKSQADADAFKVKAGIR